MYKHFDIAEFDCSHTGTNEMSENFLYDLDELRKRCGFPFKITSGYRDPSHPAEASKASPGQHSKGVAADIAVNGGAQRYIIVAEALNMGFEGVGVAKGFVHVDARKTTPVLWSY
tara:strand:- start:1250 stop:1594 length:345 start_codon:yes stop_codon:yes gene_type:complete